MEWFCLPRPDSPSVFGAMLDRSAGTFRLGPDECVVPSQRRYVPGTLVLETTWQTPDGWLVVQDCLVLDRWQGGPRSERFRRAPGEFVGGQCLLRTVNCIEGDVEVVLNCMPAFDYGRESEGWTYGDDDYGTVTAAPPSGPELRLTTSMRLDLMGPRAFGHVHLSGGERAFCALTWGDGAPPADPEAAHDVMHETEHHWRRWLKEGVFPDHPWRSYLERSALTLKGLSHAPSGAVLAAATTSLPEAPGGERNWDYRYTWVRDSAFMLWGLFTLGFDWEAYEYYAFLIEETTQAELQIMYGIDGERELTESTLDHLHGYGGAQPVRIGNGAYDQRQHDVWGMLVDSIAIHAGKGLTKELSSASWSWIEALVEGAIRNWKEPDRGIWEVRGEPQHFTASKAMCWVALDRGVRLAKERGDETRAAQWQAVADEIHADVCEHGVDERGVFSQTYDGDTPRRLAPPPADHGLPAARRRTDPQDRPRDRRRADRARPGPPLQDRAHRRRARRQGGDVHDLLVLARAGPDADRRARSRKVPLRAPALAREPAPALRGGARFRERPTPRELPPGVHPPFVDHRGRRPDPGRGRGCMTARGGVDLGGTKIQTVVVDEAHKVLRRGARPDPARGRARGGRRGDRRR